MSFVYFLLDIRYIFIFYESWCFNLKFGIKQSEIGWKFAEQWLPKAKCLGSAGDRQPNFFREKH